VDYLIVLACVVAAFLFGQACEKIELAKLVDTEEPFQVGGVPYYVYSSTECECEDDDGGGEPAAEDVKEAA